MEGAYLLSAAMQNWWLVPITNLYFREISQHATEGAFASNKAHNCLSKYRNAAHHVPTKCEGMDNAITGEQLKSFLCKFDC